jgi:hypothetical protein
MDFYLNAFLLYEEVNPAAEGVHHADMFPGYWLIRKSLWASPDAIRSSAASLKKFYTFMFEEGAIDKNDLDALKADIKTGMPEWLGTMERYDNPSITDPGEIWGL